MGSLLAIRFRLVQRPGSGTEVPTHIALILTRILVHGKRYLPSRSPILHAPLASSGVDSTFIPIWKVVGAPISHKFLPWQSARSMLHSPSDGRGFYVTPASYNFWVRPATLGVVGRSFVHQTLGGTLG